MKRNHLVVLLFLAYLLSLHTVLADADDAEEDDEEEDDEPTVFGLEAEGLGDVALYLFVGAVSIVVWKPLFKWLRANGPELLDREPRAFKRQLGVFNRRFMKAHNWIGLFAAILGTVHGYVLEWHWTLWAGTGAMWLLVISGYMMQWKWPPREFRRGARLLHMQRALTVLSIALLWVGHQILG